MTTATVFVPHRVSCRPRSARSWITATGPLFVFWHRNENGCMTVRHTKEPRLTGWLDVDDSRGKMQFSEIRSVPLVICLLRVKSPCVVGSWYVIQKEEIFIIFFESIITMPANGRCQPEMMGNRQYGQGKMDGQNCPLKLKSCSHQLRLTVPCWTYEISSVQ